MKATSDKLSIVGGGLLVLFGTMALVGTFTDLSVWAWIAVLAASGLGVLIVYLTDRSVWGLLIPAYALWVVAGLLVLTELEFLPDIFIALYTLVAVALPFLVVFLRNRSQWWALIPAYVLLVIGIIITLTEQHLLPDELVATCILSAIALPFLVVFLSNRSQWWALIPAYVLLAVGAMVLLIELRILGDLLVPAYVMFAIALPFFVVYARNPKEWWPLIPGGIMAGIGLVFLLVSAAIQYVFAAILIGLGILILARQFTRRKQQQVETPPPDASETDESVEEL